MIVPTSPLSPGHPASFQENRNPTSEGSASYCQCQRLPEPEELHRAAENMRHRLVLLDPSERRISIEDYVAAVLESSSTEHPA